MVCLNLGEQRKRPNKIPCWGVNQIFRRVPSLSAHLHRLAFSDVGEKGNLASTVNLQGKGTLMLCAQARCSLGKNLPQTIHELLQLCGPLIVERELLLTDSAFSLSTMKHT